MKTLQPSYDYIVIGGGSAGCVVAARLIQQKAGTVLLLEAGSADSNPFHAIPGAVVKVFQRKSWPYMTEPQPHANDRSLIIAQGRVLGGGSSVNGMIYIRGQAADYDDWATEWGCTEWRYRDVLPYFRKAEANESLGTEFHGQQGPLPVSENRYRHPLTGAFVRAGQEIGLPYVNDFNGASQRGIGYYQTTTHNGERASTARTYLKSVRDDARLTIATGALVHRILVEQGRAVGVAFSERGCAPITIRARREIVLSAGAIGSPKVLMLSGIGPRDHLSDLGIETIADLPVGRNFHDHLHLSVQASIRTKASLLGADRGLAALAHFLQWRCFRSGLLTSNILEGGAFIDSLGAGRPDIQLHFLPLLDNFDNTPGEKPPASEHGITVKAGHLQPKSRGRVLLRSTDAADLPRIDANFLSHPDDLSGQMRAVQAGLDVLAAPALRAHVREIVAPSRLERGDDRALEAFVRQNVKTVYHPAGTCRMGTDPASSVVDQALRVHGVANLRVVDCSICPQVPSGNTNAPSIMIGERGADLLLGRNAPAASAAPAAPADRAGRAGAASSSNH
ncbi:GMC family oxidoreductase [Burkholderia thailandensis]|uniref:GMC oxidoreductase family protein n=1 Tax=Burkholderia thailandensis TaxID=57975 RepID=A0AAW9CX89_BURTH|nr:GMC family oxidoreductase N-terminal domain-containing protein [Burkholderia thailandensis]AIP66183.1 glucose-methanol-choline oxidoreductase [Burkholderia thailandensis]AOI53995.1 glucose-methanol-choline oxidoreductase [Burkholderia thailandensis]MCS3392367.1 GMC family oxidoreductase N-terminal domain-containing protein [Burkholderia thailandensis]MCS6425352.1 GMC family oxidoreductase N-terminal domain-containing protein [Burkholderia thailandensis]MCS6453654.1 GMC family oxidoreductase